MAFCQKCGKQIEDSVNNCPWCGALNASNPNAKSVNISKIASGVKSSPYAKYIGFILGAIVVLGVVITVLVSIFSGGYKTTVKDYYEVFYEGNVGIYEELAPEIFYEKLEEKFSLDENDFEERLENSTKLSLQLLEAEYGENLKVKVKITDEDDYDEDELEALKATLKSFYGIPKKLVRAAMEVELKVFRKGDEDEESVEEEMVLVKIGRKWYSVEAFSRLMSVAY